MEPINRLMAHLGKPNPVRAGHTNAQFWDPSHIAIAMIAVWLRDNRLCVTVSALAQRSGLSDSATAKKVRRLSEFPAVRLLHPVDTGCPYGVCRRDRKHYELSL